MLALDTSPVSVMSLGVSPTFVIFASPRTPLSPLDKFLSLSFFLSLFALIYYHIYIKHNINIICEYCSDQGYFGPYQKVLALKATKRRSPHKVLSSAAAVLLFCLSSYLPTVILKIYLYLFYICPEISISLRPVILVSHRRSLLLIVLGIQMQQLGLTLQPL